MGRKTENSIEWHEEIVRNLRAYYLRLVVELEKAIEAEQKHGEALARYEDQVRRAKAMGKTSFDRSKF